MIHRLYKKLDKLIIVTITILAILAGLIHFAYSKQANMPATEDDLGRPFAKYWVNWESILTDDVQVIGCINTKTLKTYEPLKGSCIGVTTPVQNIMIPKLEDIYTWKYFWNDSSIINRLPIVNFESGFNPNAENAIAIGYIQTLKKYNIGLSLKDQLGWMAKRQKHQVDTPSCGKRASSGESRVMSCLYSRHFGHTTEGWYAKKALATRTYYINYLIKHKH